MVRTFIGIFIPQDIKTYASGIQQRIKSLDLKATFVEPENFHISLSFLGEIDDQKIEIIKSKLDEIAKLYEQFEIKVKGILFIPSENFIRVMALDVESIALESLRNEIVKGLGGQSHPSHITLARVKDIADKKIFMESARKFGFSEFSFKVTDLYLVGSSLKRGGPVYTKLHRAHLK